MIQYEDIDIYILGHPIVKIIQSRADFIHTREIPLSSRENVIWMLNETSVASFTSMD